MYMKAWMLVLKCIWPKLFDAKCTWLVCLLSFPSLLLTKSVWHWVSFSWVVPFFVSSTFVNQLHLNKRWKVFCFQFSLFLATFNYFWEKTWSISSVHILWLCFFLKLADFKRCLLKVKNIVSWGSPWFEYVQRVPWNAFYEIIWQKIFYFMKDGFPKERIYFMHRNFCDADSFRKSRRKAKFFVDDDLEV